MMTTALRRRINAAGGAPPVRPAAGARASAASSVRSSLARRARAPARAGDPSAALLLRRLCDPLQRRRARPFPPRAAPRRVAGRLPAHRRAVGEPSPADQPGVLRPEHAAEPGPRLLPEPGGGDRIAPDARGLGGPGRTRTPCSASSSPTSRPCWSTAWARRATTYRVPIDECYKLVGLIRTHWRGLSGGTEVWEEIGRFFDELRERAQPRRRAVACRT